MKMKKLAGILFALFVVSQVSAAEGEWLTDFAKAQAKAKQEGKMVLLEFTGSDWCAPCKALHKQVFSKKEFLEFAKDRLVLVEVDFPIRKKLSEEQKQANEDLGRKYKVEGYPTVIVLDKDGKLVFEQGGYRGDAKGYLKNLMKGLSKKS